MKIGIIALIVVFLASGMKNIQDSGMLSRIRKSEQREEAAAEQAVYDKRKLLFGILMLVMAVLVLVYTLVS